MLPWDVPVDPEPPEARQWLVDGLSKPQYQAAKPTLFDQIAKAISDWFSSLQIGTVEGPPAFGKPSPAPISPARAASTAPGAYSRAGTCGVVQGM